jgi:hypothetical protein
MNETMKHRSLIFTTGQFLFDKERKIFEAESSKLIPSIIDKPPRSMYIKSDLTGFVAEFIYKNGILNAGNIISGFAYHPTLEALENYSGLFGYEVHIMND